MKRFRQTLIAFLIVVPSIGVGCSLYRSLTATPSHSISLANGKFSVQGEENQDLPMLGQQADGGLCSIPTVEITNFSPQVLVDQETTIQFDPAAQLDGNTFLLVGHAGSIPAVSACHLTNEQIQAFQIFSIHLDPGENAFSFSLNFPAEIALAFAFQSPSGSIQVTSVIHISVTSVIQTGNPTYVFAAVGDMGRPDTTGTPLGSGNGNGSGLGGGVYSRTLLERIHAAGAQF